jgi:tetratricopeptide (TPR) repeat protein
MDSEELSDRLSNHQKKQNKTPQNPDSHKGSAPRNRPDSGTTPDFWRDRPEVSPFQATKKTAIPGQKRSRMLPFLETHLSSDNEAEDFLLPLADLQKLINQKKQQGDIKDPTLSILYASVGKIYQNRVQRGKYRDYFREQALAVKYFEKAISLQEELGQEIELADSLNRLGVLYYYQGRHQEVEPLFAQSLGIRKRLLGENHFDVATSLSNLGMANNYQGRYAEAEPLLWQALGIFKRILGENHHAVAIALNNLANLYYSQNRYQEAELLLLHALEIFQRLLGENHPNVARSLNNLGMVYYYQRRFEAAEPLYRQAWEIYQGVLGDHHPDTIICRENLTRIRDKMP